MIKWWNFIGAVISFLFLILAFGIQLIWLRVVFATGAGIMVAVFVSDVYTLKRKQKPVEEVEINKIFVQHFERNINELINLKGGIKNEFRKNGMYR